MKFHELYIELLNELVQSEQMTDERTGAKIRTLGTHSFTIDLSDGYLPQINVRRTYPKTSAVELAWFLTGNPEASFLTQHTTIWDDFLEDLGPIGRPGETGLLSAYGYRWRGLFDIDQILTALSRLRSDISTRQIWISSWDPNTDLLGPKFSSNVPCPVGFTFRVINNKLNSLYVLRSSDSFVGLPYDVMCHANLMKLVANSLGVELGKMHVAVSDLHVYESHIPILNECLSNKSGETHIELPLPDLTVEDVIKDPESLILWYSGTSEYKEYQSKLPTSTKPKVYT